MKIICYACPNKLKRKSQIDYNKILLDEINKEKLMDVIIEDLIEKLNCNISIKISVDVLEKEFDKASNETQLQIIAEAEQIRHLFIHNGGIIDSKFNERLNKKLEIGTKYKIKKDAPVKYYNQYILLGTELFDKITNRYLK